MDTTKIIIASVAFQTAWLLSIVFGSIVAVPVTIAMWFLNNYLMPFRKRHWCFIASVVALGIVVDTLFELSGVLIFAEFGLLPPLWLVCLWVLFAMLIVVVLPKIISQFTLFIVLSVIGGSLSYIAGVALSPVEFGYSAQVSYSVLAITWLIVGSVTHFLYKIGIGLENEKQIEQIMEASNV